jgi:N-glycosidase YbiA
MASEAEHVLFYRVDEPYGFMSNFARYPIQLDGRECPRPSTTSRPKKSAGRAEEEQVRAARSAREAAHLGRALPGPRGDWDAVKDEVMLKVLRAKFTQHADLRAQLVATGKRRLVEHTTNDA